MERFRISEVPAAYAIRFAQPALPLGEAKIVVSVLEGVTTDLVGSPRQQD